MTRKIFISYRRQDVKDSAARIRDRLAAEFGAPNVFMDVDNLLAGQRFDKELDRSLSESHVFLAIIGPRWRDLFDERAKGNQSDFVHMEIAGAMKRGIVVIPVLVEGATLPDPAQLPEDIRDLVLHQKQDVTYERFGRDVAELISAIKTVGKFEAPRSPLRKYAAGLAAAVVLAPALYLADDRLGYLEGPPVMTASSPAKVTEFAAATGSLSETDVAADEQKAAKEAQAKAESERQARLAAEKERAEADAKAKAEAERQAAALAAEKEQEQRAAALRAESDKRIQEERDRYRAELEAARQAEVLAMEQRKAEAAARAAEAEAARASEERQAREREAAAAAAQQRSDERPSGTETFRIAAAVSQGIHNMRSGPGTGHSLVVSIPANSTGVEVTMSTCRAPDDGRSTKQWCKARWRGYSGWLSMGGLVR